jgi:hypothetical protein
VLAGVICEKNRKKGRSRFSSMNRTARSVPRRTRVRTFAGASTTSSASMSGRGGMPFRPSPVMLSE